ncbi:hypothetical protein CcI156_20315 [Frankia sp. CcI156]|uniref:GNAT family N-acetyltransferase n=1 Tax=unclassified Frankia TaxID=2632575 RepID=UPI0003CFB8E1|nr:MULTISPECIES: GNAT family N-acetyltransferase [unclassified Frankia]ETA03179.1 hypothetical protein CcI6DRAFT_01334 [Frankia sp. CcI6]KDA40849.1 hypothetical protein BMG523Draft_04340 [Frankia sp. BMG5.23]KFB02650.1 Acetyltransferase (GNAT) domain [Frankia sp. Allo2]OHV50975.1 hypothetical protein CgIS1_19840 [Frankia sp. CgIS1]ONH22821.1 hypothetical protein CcI156_20315 [Frankia sp. CcI156]
MIDVTTCTTLAEATAYAPVWEEMPADGASGIFTSPAWCLAAWRFFPDLGSPRLLVANSTESGPLGILPLTAGANGLTWAGSPLGDEHDVRLRPESPHAGPAVARLVQEIVSRSPSTASVLLTDVRPAGVLVDFAPNRPGTPAPVLHLREPDSAWGSLACIPGWSRGRWRELRRLRRACERSGPLTMTRITEPVQLHDAIPDFVAARLAAWRTRGRFDELPVMDRHPRFPEFLATAASGLARTGRCLLAQLLYLDRPIAQALYFRLGSADLLYMSTFDPEFAGYCPSHQLLAEAAAAAIQEGVSLIEMGRGDEPYKFDLGASPRHLREVLAPG